MKNLSITGRIFYGIAVAQTGMQTIYYHDFPYWLIPPKHSWIPGLTVLAYIFGAALILAGACMVFEKKPRQASLLLGSVLLMIFVFYYLPYKFLVSANYLDPIGWDSALKELAFASGTLIVAGCYSDENENKPIKFLAKLIPAGPILFSIALLSFGTFHFLYAEGVSGYMPTWIPYPIFWIYLGGVGLFGSGVSIILKIKTRLIARLLGSMILTWFVILHIPKVISAPAPYLPGELTSAFIALAYCGIAFVIAGAANKTA